MHKNVYNLHLNEQFFSNRRPSCYKYDIWFIQLTSLTNDMGSLFFGLLHSQINLGRFDLLELLSEYIELFVDISGSVNMLKIIL